MPNFICQEQQHNKFWNYTIDGNSVNIEYGRVGGSKQTDSKSFGSVYELNAFVQKKVREKEKKGYKEVSEEKLIKESNIAQNLGTQNKICEMNFVKYNVNDNSLYELNSYDENESILIKMMNSWTKEETFYVINNDICKRITNLKRKGYDYSFSMAFGTTYDIKEGLVLAIEDVAGKIEKMLVDFSTLTRAINLESDSNKKKIKLQEFSRKVNLETGISEQVAEKFVSLGSRKIVFANTETKNEFTKEQTKRKMML